METVHVQLSHERGVVVVFEQLWNQRPREFVFVEYYERVSVVLPPDEILILVVIEKTTLCKH